MDRLLDLYWEATVGSFPKSYQLCLEAERDFSEGLVFLWRVQLNGRRVSGLKAAASCICLALCLMGLWVSV